MIDYSVVRIAQGVTHFSPGSYDSMPTCATPIPNMFMSGDWIVNDHGSFSQGKVFQGLCTARFGQSFPVFRILLYFILLYLRFSSSPLGLCG